MKKTKRTMQIQLISPDEPVPDELKLRRTQPEPMAGRYPGMFRMPKNNDIVSLVPKFSVKHP